MSGDPAARPSLPPGSMFTVLGPVAAMALLFTTLASTPPGGPVGGPWAWPCVGGAVALAAWTVRWLLRLPRPIGALRWCAAAPALLLCALLVGLSLVLALGAGTH